MSWTSFSWRALSSASSRFSPLASRSRSTARPPMARPSASMARPASVTSCIEKPSPRARSASTACSIACALSGSSQAPNASTRCGTDPVTTSVVSPMMSGSLSAAAQDTRICGSDISSAWKRSRSAVSVMISSRERLVGGRGAQPRAHQHDRGDDGEQQHAEGERDGGEIVAAEFGERIEIAVEVLQAGEFGVRAEGHGAEQRRGGREDREESPSSRMSTMSPARRPDRFRHSRCAPAQPAPALTAANHRGLYATRESRRKSPDRERWRWRPGVAGSDSRFRSEAVAQRLGLAHQFVEADPAQRRRERPLGLADRRHHHVVQQGGAGGRIAGVLDGAGGAQDVVGGDAAPLARELVAAARPADALEDADPDQGLQHRLQMTGGQGMAGGQRLRGYRTAPAMKRDVDDGSNREKSLAGKQRHAGTAFVIPYNGMILRPAFPLFVNWPFAGGTEAPRATPCFIELFRL